MENKFELFRGLILASAAAVDFVSESLFDNVYSKLCSG